MNLLPKSHEDFSQKEYWNSFFAKRGKKAFEWYGEYPELCENIHKYVKTKDDILIIGCGNSNLSMDMYDIGFKKITNIDISKVVIKQMLDLNAKQRPEMKFEQMDVMNMSFQDESFSVIIDKGTLDALMPNSEQETEKQITKMFQEIQRVLKFGGRYVCISLLQEHILKKLLDYFPKENWMFRVVRCHDVERKTKENGENSLPVFLVVCTKFKQLPNMILETCLAGSSFQRHASPGEITAQVSAVQQAALVCAGLQRGGSALGSPEDEVTLELSEPGASTRYTVYVQEMPGKGRGVYAAFIVPQGRETEWLFATKEGRRNLLKSANCTRLAIVTMHRGQKYENLEKVKEELSSTILALAPPNIPKSIPYLSLGDDVGKREIRYEGESEFSGKFVVEDVTNDQGDTFRRLVFLNNQNVIQSEAKLKKNLRIIDSPSALLVGGGGGGLCSFLARALPHVSTTAVDIDPAAKSGVSVPDSTHLSCEHHVYMCVGVCLSSHVSSPSALLVGVGGGGLCSFLARALPQVSTTAVDIDPAVIQVARTWFGLQDGERMKVVEGDGVRVVEEEAGKDVKYNAVLFDVDSKDSTVGMSCPPKEFLEEQVLQNVNKLIGDQGIFILNLVLRDESLRNSIITKLKNNFASIISYKLEQDLNEIIFCRNNNKTTEENILKNEIKLAAEKLNTTVRKRKIQNNNLVDISSLMESLQLN